MNQDAQKKAAAEAALAHVPHDAVIGVGTGSTANHFIQALGGIKACIAGAVALSALGCATATGSADSRPYMVASLAFHRAVGAMAP